MQAASQPSPNGSPAHTWFADHLPELTQRCRAAFRRLPTDLREEAEAEVIGSIFKYVAGAAARGKLARLTVPTLVMFFGKLCKSGRKTCGGKSGDVFADVARRRQHHQVFSLSEARRIRTDHGERIQRLSDVLADRREDSPPENVRRNLDYPTILDHERVSPKARRVFEHLTESHGAGSQKELARELGISSGRITQLKSHLATCLAKHGYAPSVPRTTAKMIGGKARGKGMGFAHQAVRI